ncbi:beta-sandwich lipoprotein [Nocardia xishanensis]|uniref:beta-sandwich lipoprotein n=1 Tax=Nocardia xishanensis TaxID=238964 RepID=UPI0009FC369D|nr:hypothetical protein [Nocardia xishanensis]
MKNTKWLRVAAAMAGITLAASLMAGCSSDADVANENIKKAAEQFEISRRIVAINGVTDKYLLVVEGRCSIEWPDSRADIICKLDDGSYIKHTVHLSDNVTVMSEQTNGTQVSTDHYRVVFKPEVLLPNVDRP